MDRAETLFFTGHRNIYRPEGSEAFAHLCTTIRSFIEKNYKFFITGGAIGFDTMAAEAVIKLRTQFPEIKLILMLPCKNQTAEWSVWQVRKYSAIMRMANDVIYTAAEYSKGCMFARNRAMVNASSACIAYCKNSHGGTSYTVSYALSEGLSVTNLANAF